MCFLPAALFVQRKTLRTTTTLFLLIAFLFIAELAQAARFATTTVFRSGGSARYSAGADVNGDGNPDILASNDQALTNGGLRGVLTVLLGKGDGTFLPPKWIADFPDGAPQFAVGDFNRDGRPDLAVTSAVDFDVSTVRIYLGRGDGTFAAPLSFSTGGIGPWQIIAADLNRDGNLDLVVSMILNQTVDISVLMGNGNGTFQKPAVIPIPKYLESFAVGDRNGDGRPDLAVSGTFGVMLLLGDGAGHFGPPVLVPSLASGPLQMVDLDGDGRAEIVSGLTISWGDGTCCTVLSTGASVASLTVKDLNGDGRPDIAGTDGESVTILINQGARTFSTPVSYTLLARGGNSLTAADFNRDGKLDLVVSAGAAGIQPFLNLGGGRFDMPLKLQVAAFGDGGPVGIGAADLNGDGRTDLALQVSGHYFDVPGPSGPYFALLSKGNGQFTVVPEPGFGGELYMQGGPFIGDFNHDGRPDLLAEGSGDNTPSGLIGLAFNEGGGHFTPLIESELPHTPEHGALATGYFNAGANADIAVISVGENAVHIYLGNGDGTFRGPNSYHVGVGPSYILVCDVNRDGKADLVVTNGDSNEVSVLLGNGDGTFQSARSIPVLSPHFSAAFGDFNRDGKTDLVLGGDTVEVLLGHGDGTFGAPVKYPAKGFVRQADLRRINKEDILVATGDTLTVLYGNGDGTFLPPTAYRVAPNLGTFAVGDFNDDGAPDVVVTDTDALTLLLNKGGNYTTLKSSATSIHVGQSVTFTATVLASVPGSGVPTGTVAIKDGAKGIGFVSLVKGKATFTTSALSAGTHTMTASYWGNGFFNPQISSPVTVRLGP